MTDTTTRAAVTDLRKNPLQQGLLFLSVVARYALLLVALLVYLLLAPWGYAAFALLVFFPIVGQKRRRAWLQAAMRTGFGLLHRFAGWFRALDVRIDIDRTRLPDGPFVVVANHPTLVDVTAILRTIEGSCTVVKPVIYKRWWLRPLMEGSGQLEGATNPLAASRLVDRAVARIRGGMSMVIFPEGTRTVEGREMPFHRMAFEIACRAGVPVVSLRLRCEPSWLSKSRPLFKIPPTVPVLSVSVLAIFDPARFDYDSRRLCEHVRAVYQGVATPSAGGRSSVDEAVVGIR